MLKCHELPCNLDGGWSDWSQWTSCTGFCTNATKTHHRSCTNPSPRGTGLPCPGADQEDGACLGPCPIDGGWSEWSAWTTCSVTCYGAGQNWHTRTCDNPVPQNGGLDCTGDDIEYQVCGEILCPVWVISNPRSYINHPGSIGTFLHDGCEVHQDNSGNGIWLATYSMGSDNNNPQFRIEWELPVTTRLFGIYIKNIQNDHWDNAGTKDFKVETSLDGNSWNQVLSDTMQDIRNLACQDIPLEYFSFSPGMNDNSIFSDANTYYFIQYQQLSG